MAPEESRPAPAAAVGRPARWVLFAVVQAGLLTLTAPLVYYRIFGALTPYDDEGFMMMTVQHVLDGHRLYDEVLTAYGPLYYLYKWVLHGPFGLPLSHDVVRLNAAVLWLGTAVASSGVVFAMTGGLALAAIAHVLTVLGLESIAVEPGHPQEMAVLIVVAIVLMSAVADRAAHTRRIAGVGILVGLLTMIKINVGVLAGAAVWMALASARLWAVSAAGILVLPVLLIWQRLDQWMPFTVSEVAAIGSVALMTRATAREDRGLGGIAVFSAAWVAGIALGLLFPLIRDASLSAVVECLVLMPRRLVEMTVKAPMLQSWSPALASVAVALAALCAWLPPHRLRTRPAAAVVAVAKLAFAAGAALAYWYPWLPYGFWYIFPGLTPFVWLVLVPGASAAPHGPFPRLVLVWLAVLQPLQAYPVAGSQLRIGTILHVVCAMVMLGDVRDWAAVAFPGFVRPVLLRAGSVLALAALMLLTHSRVDLMRTWYERLSPLDLPGAARVRAPRAHVTALQKVVEALRVNADTFLTYPGLNSLYFWTGKRPPTLHVLSHDVRFYSEEQRAAMIRALLTHQHPYVVRSRDFVPADSAFVRAISRSFEPSAVIGPYRLLARRE